LAKALFKSGRLDLNIYRRDVRNFADDDQLLNTGVSYPISFDHGIIYGAEGKFELVDVGRLSGFASYSYMEGFSLGRMPGMHSLNSLATSQPRRINATL
jgi:hypothetical protein